MVDQRFNIEARQRKYEALRAERQASKLARARAEFANGPKTIRLDGPIGDREGEFGARWLRSELPIDGREVRLVIHSEGGSVFECLAMLDLLEAYPGKVTGIVASAAFSAASLLLTACDEVHGTANSFVMIHNSSFDDEAMSQLDESERQLLASLDETMCQRYAERTGQSAHAIRTMMERETFLDASEAKRLGFIDRIESPKNLRIVAKKISRQVVAKVSATARWKSAVAALAATMPKAKALLEADRQNPGLRLKYLEEFNSKSKR